MTNKNNDNNEIYSNLKINKSEILFIFDSSYNIPNGDPFTGEQRFDEETKKILISDVRIKRYIRDYFISKNQLLEPSNEFDIYVQNFPSKTAEKDKNEDLDTTQQGKKQEKSKKKKEKVSGASARVKMLREKYKDDPNISKSPIALLQKCLDVRLFGGISTEKDAAVNLTGPVQFRLLNSSLNSVDLRMHQNTSVFSSDVTENERGAIGTTTVVPYAINQIHGWINPFSAIETGLTENDILLMFEGLWNQVNIVNTRSKANQNSLLLLKINYKNPVNKIYGIDQLIKIKSDKKDEQFRSMKDYEFDFRDIITLSENTLISSIEYFTENDKIDENFRNKDKFKTLKF